MESTDNVKQIASLPDRVGIVAGWGDFPVTVARTLQAAGVDVYCTLLHGHADPILNQYCVKTQPVGVARLGAQLRFFRRHNVHHVTLAGKVFKTILFQKFAWLKHLPDFQFIRYFHRTLHSGKLDRNDDALIMCCVRAYQDAGIKVEAATDLAPELLIEEGILTQRRPSASAIQDIAYGWHLAKEMGRLDVGQTVIVQGRAVLAIEAVEGTDQCIERAKGLCPKGGFTVVKVAKPNQDMRFDVPTIGINTLKNVHAAGGKTLAIQAGKTIALDKKALIQFANKVGMTLVAIGPDLAKEFLGHRQES